ncbi:hypothetical protein OPT61_g8584 [Boeremia exigua]|uniref:Uncharacterized protein n=1 Tax=Boeremia exigua TaxID=749465 RepID=A0ACC2HXV4_9PLEO|nr:hypothetical protein OPT61_g8584 [Boeremia exigua]
MLPANRETSRTSVLPTGALQYPEGDHPAQAEKSRRAPSRHAHQSRLSVPLRGKVNPRHHNYVVLEDSLHLISIICEPRLHHELKELRRNAPSVDDGWWSSRRSRIWRDSEWEVLYLQQSADLPKYPTEFVKTRQQLRGVHLSSQSPFRILTSTIRDHGIDRLHTGGAMFCISNASKSGVRFLTFDYVRTYMSKDDLGNTKIVGDMLAGTCAGVAESVLVLTPRENLKTRLIEDRTGPHAFRPSTHAIRDIMRNEGPRSLFRDVWPVTLNQSTNAMVRFSIYNYISRSLKPLKDIVGGPTSAVAGALAGVITIYCTMPFDILKTQIQSRHSNGTYTSSWDCAQKLVRRGGVTILWKGTTPRLVRLSCDGGIPACENCQKAAEPCIDVDGRNNSLSIPRDFAANARARIQWLEQQVRLLNPSFKLNDGPRVDFSFLEEAAIVKNQAPPSPVLREANQPIIPSSPKISHSSSKRFRGPSATDAGPDAFPDEARSVALDLGLMTLNSDSRQTHYLGTSSGRLFTRLIGAGSPDGGNSRDKSPSFSNIQGSSRKGLYASTKHVKESCRLVYHTLKTCLPSEDDARLLLEVYFRNIHVDHPFLHPESLLQAVEALYQCATADTTDEIGHNGWVASVQPFAYNGEYERSRNIDSTPITIFTATFHVFMVFTLAATVRTRQGAYDFAPNQFYRVAMTADQHCLSNTSVASLQAALLLTVHSLLSPTELNIWTLTYVSMAHCVDLGLHRNLSDDCGLSRAAVLTRKLVFFSVYHLDRSVASIQGRPLGIRDETFDLQLPTSADIEFDTAKIGDRKFSPSISLAGSAAFAIHRFKLDPIISEIKLLFYHLPSRVSVYVWPNDKQSSQITIGQKLQEWCDTLINMTASLQFDEEEWTEHEKYRLKLTSQYYATMVLLHQPSQAMPQPSEHSILMCYECAAKRLEIYHRLYQLDSYLKSWRSVQGIFSSGATMIYCLWSSSLVRRTVPLSVAMRDLRTCTNLLSVGGEFWPSVKKGKESFSRAMDALARKFDQSHHAQHQQSEPSDGPQPKHGRNDTSEIVLQDQPIFRLPPDTDTVDQTHHAHLNFFPTAFDMAESEWPTLENSTFAYDATNSSNTTFGVVQEAPDNTVEAFIAEFLNSDTSWNPF